MVEQNTQLQLVTFQLGEEHYGIDIMEVDSIVQKQEVRPIPNAPAYVEGIFNLRGEIIPIVNLHKRFQLNAAELSEEDKLLSGFMIVDIKGTKIGIVIDKVSKVEKISENQVQPPPQMLSGIGAEYIRGVCHQDNGYLIILDIHRMFDPNDLRQLETIRKR